MRPKVAIVVAFSQLPIDMLFFLMFGYIRNVASVIQLTLLFTGMALCFYFLSLDMYRDLSSELGSWLIKLFMC